jgi:hypothetical protein
MEKTRTEGKPSRLRLSQAARQKDADKRNDLLSAEMKALHVKLGELLEQRRAGPDVPGHATLYHVHLALAAGMDLEGALCEMDRVSRDLLITGVQALAGGQAPGPDQSATSN